MTNLYALPFFDNLVKLSKSFRLYGWVDCTVDEIKAYVGLHIMRGLCSKPSLPDKWFLKKTKYGCRDCKKRGNVVQPCLFQIVSPDIIPSTFQTLKDFKVENNAFVF